MKNNLSDAAGVRWPTAVASSSNNRSSIATHRAAAALCIHVCIIPGTWYILPTVVDFGFFAGDLGEGVGHGEMMCVLGVGVSSGLGPLLVVCARGQCGGIVMMRAVFGAQLPSCQLLLMWIPCGLTTLQRWFPRIPLACVNFCCMFFAERSEIAPRKIGIIQHEVCRV